MTDLDRAKYYIDNAILNGDCLECHVKPDQYGYCNTTGGERVHRLVYRELVCDPGELFVLHKCDNRRCINTQHLFHGTQKDNMQDMQRKGRKASTRGNTRALTPNQIQKIFELRKLGFSYRKIALLFNVSYSTIENLISGRRGYADVNRS